MTTTSHSGSSTHVVLVPGYWLGAWAWDGVLPALRDAGLTPHPVTLPGLGGAGTAQGPRPGITLEDHVAAVRELVDGLPDDVVLVGHSGGAVVVQMVADQRPERVRRVVYVDAGPLLDGATAGARDAREDVPLPSWEALAEAGTSAEGLDEDTRAQFRARAVPHPAGVATAPVRLTDPRRLDVPVTAVCASIPSPDLRRLVAAGVLPSELAACSDVEYVDLPTGHWPMLSRPGDLAAVIAVAARR